METTTDFPAPAGWEPLSGAAICAHRHTATQVTVVYRYRGHDRTQEIARYNVGDLAAAQSRLARAKSDHTSPDMTFGLCWWHTDCPQTSPEAGLCKTYQLT